MCKICIVNVLYICIWLFSFLKFEIEWVYLIIFFFKIFIVREMKEKIEEKKLKLLHAGLEARIKTQTWKVPASSPNRTQKNRILTRVLSCVSLIWSGPGEHQNSYWTRILSSLIRSDLFFISHNNYEVALIDIVWSKNVNW